MLRQAVERARAALSAARARETATQAANRDLTREVATRSPA